MTFTWRCVYAAIAIEAVVILLCALIGPAGAQPEKVELDRDSPDGLSHLCASAFKFVFCFKEGGGT